MSRHLEKLRGLLYTTPRRAAWLGIVQFFDTLPTNADRGVITQYAAEHLASWPLEDCPPPEHWLPPTLTGQPHWATAIIPKPGRDQNTDGLIEALGERRWTLPFWRLMHAEPDRILPEVCAAIRQRTTGYQHGIRPHRIHQLTRLCHLIGASLTNAPLATDALVELYVHPENQPQHVMVEDGPLIAALSESLRHIARKNPDALHAFRERMNSQFIRHDTYNKRGWSALILLGNDLDTLLYDKPLTTAIIDSASDYGFRFLPPVIAALAGSGHRDLIGNLDLGAVTSINDEFFEDDLILSTRRLGVLGAEAVPLLCAWMGFPSTRVRSAALETLQSLGPQASDAVDDLTAMASKDPVDLIRALSGRCLRALTPAGRRQDIIDLLDITKEPIPWVKHDLAETIAHLEAHG